MSGTYAMLPIDGMNKMVRDLAAQEPEIRREALDVGSIALKSEAQVVSPIEWGDLKASHTVFQADEDHAIIGCNEDYALAVHETHPTNPRWFVNTVQREFKRIMGGAIKRALENAAGRARQ